MNTLGNKLRVTVFGQSHAPSIGCVVEGLPAGFAPDMERLSAFMTRRAPGRNAWSTPRQERDEPEILSGLVEGRTCRKYTDEEEAAEAAVAAGYTDIYKRSLIGITEMEKLMGKKRFAEVLGKLVYKPQGKITLVPESDKRQEVLAATAEADFKEE